MPVPSSISDLSTTPSLNSPAGTESPSTVDDYLRTHAAFIKQVDGGAVKAADLAAPGGSAMVGYDGGTAQAVLDEAKPMANYTALRAYTGRATGVRITQAGIAGFFQRDDADTTSADNGGTIIVDASGRRWKRLFSPNIAASWFGAKGDGTTDNALTLKAACDYIKTLQKRIPAYTNANQYSGVTLDLEPGATYYLSASVIIPGQCHVRGNNAAVFSDAAITLFSWYGWEGKISDVRFYKGAKAIVLNHGNVDQGVAVIENCSFSGQTSLCVDSTGASSTHLQLTDNKFVTAVPALYSECDVTTVTGGWITAQGAEVSYFTSKSHLVADGVLMVPSMQGSPTEAQKQATYWFQVGTATQLRGNLTCRRVRFGGEDRISYLKSYAKAGSDVGGERWQIDIQNCLLGAIGALDLVEIPNALTIKNNIRGVSAIATVKAASAGAVAATSGMRLWDIDSDIITDGAAVQYRRQEFQRNGGGKNLISTTPSFGSFGTAQALGTGSATALTADTWPSNTIVNVTFGTKTTEPELYRQHSMATSLTGRITAQMAFSSNAPVVLTMQCGAYVERFPVSGDGVLRVYRMQANLTAAAQGVLFGVYGVPDGAVVQMGHPIVMTGAVSPDAITQAPNGTTLAVSIWNGHYHASAAPTDGAWLKGTKIYNVAPAAGGFEGWVCTASGTPGTWKTYGAIAP